MKTLTSTVTIAFLLVVGGSAIGYTQSPSVQAFSQRPTQADLNALTEARIAIVKAALQLNPEQEKFWPAIEDAIRSRAENRQKRLQAVIARADERSNRGSLEILRDRDPVAFLNRRSDA